jgi:hypothetical protein
MMSRSSGAGRGIDLVHIFGQGEGSDFHALKPGCLDGAARGREVQLSNTSLQMEYLKGRLAPRSWVAIH